MALSRLLNALSAYNEEVHDLSYETSKQSSGVSKIYTKNKALTIFIPNNDKSSQPVMIAFNNLQQACFENQPLRFGHRHDRDHAQMHQTTADYPIQHAHIIKGHKQSDFELITPKEFRCLIDLIKAGEKWTGVCRDDKSDCAISQADAEKVIKKFEEYHTYVKEKEKLPPITPAQSKALNALNDAVCHQLYAGTKTFAFTFISTLLDRYIKPYLISADMLSPKNAVKVIEASKSLLSALMANSLYRAAFETLARATISPLLTYAGISAKQTEVILRQISAGINFVKNPLSIADMLTTQGAAGLAQKTAFEVIHQLPKLKKEPAIRAKDTTTEKPDSIKNTHPTVRQRRPQ